MARNRVNIFPTGRRNWGGYVGITRAPKNPKALVNVGFSAFLDEPHVKEQLNHAAEWVFAKTGGYVMTKMRRSIRSPKKYIRDRRVTYRGTTYYVDRATPGYQPRYTDPPGWIFDWDEYRTNGQVIFAKREDAAVILADFFQMRKLDGANKPPRRGPRDLLRKFILFGYNLDTLLIGPHIFKDQPSGIAAANSGTSIPDLLESGGTAVMDQGFGVYTAEYFPHPYVEPQRDGAKKKFRQNIGEMHRRLNAYGSHLRNRIRNRDFSRAFVRL